MKCQNCNHMNDKNSKFCSNCGTKVIYDARAKSKQEVKEKWSNEEIKDQVKRHNKKVGIGVAIVSGIILLIIFIALLVNIFFDKPSNSYSSYSNNYQQYKPTLCNIKVPEDSRLMYEVNFEMSVRNKWIAKVDQHFPGRFQIGTLQSLGTNGFFYPIQDNTGNCQESIPYLQNLYFESFKEMN